MVLDAFVESGERLALPVWPSGDYSVPAMAHATISVSVSDAFWTAWHAHPGETAPQIEMALRIIVPVFMQLAVIGQGLARSHAKASPDDIVTEVDIGLEGLFRMWIARHFPADRIVGEEGESGLGGFTPAATVPDCVWIIDPIDGTSNYADGSPDVVIQLCRLKYGRPDVAVMGFPFYDVLETASFGGDMWVSPAWPGPVPNRDCFCVATEYRDDRQKEAHAFDDLCQVFDGTPYRVKSIGVNVYSLATHDDFVFYKPRIKVWDIYPPLALFRLKGMAIEMHLCILDPAQEKQPVWVDPFSENAYLRLWDSLVKEGRIGHVLLVPFGCEKKEKAMAVKELLACMSLSS